MKSLFDTTKLNNMLLKNRFVRSATCENMVNEGGHITKTLYKIYEELAKGQVGLIITGNAYVLKKDGPNPSMLGIYEDSFIEEFKELTTIVHSEGSKIIMQLVSVGDQTDNLGVNKRLCPSILKNMKNKDKCVEMDTQHIDELITAYGNAAIRAKKSGFDGVQIHCAHFFLLSKFLSPVFNVREDAYGGGIENRARIIFEIYNNIRLKVGKDFSILIKINCEDFIENGLTLKECIFVCKELAKMGLDAIEVSGGMPCRSNINTLEKEGYFKEYASQIAKEVPIPIILVGGLRSLNIMRNILNETKIEYMALSRPLLREPFLIKYWQEEKSYKSSCVSCNNCFGKEENKCIFA